SACLAPPLAGGRADRLFLPGDKQPVQGDVLYLALEASQRRLKTRMGKIRGREPWPERLEIHTKWRRLDQGGLEDIEAWCKLPPDRRMIWIDTLVKLLPAAGMIAQPYHHAF